MATSWVLLAPDDVIAVRATTNAIRTAATQAFVNFDIG
jgi:hypothetical protein